MTGGRVSYPDGIGHLDLTPHEYEHFVSAPFVDERIIGEGIMVVLVRGVADALPPCGSLPVVVAWVGDEFGAAGPAEADVIVGEGDVDDLVAAVERAPIAATTLAVLLRSQPLLDVEAGLAAESAAYSTLQAGAEFAAWRSAAASTPDDRGGPAVSACRDGDVLTVTLTRPHRHNAISTQLRDELTEALTVAVVDPSISTVHLCGEGRSFCSGGDLGEFGSRSDPASAHRVRLARSPARLIHRLRERTVVHTHGATYGGGVEMAAFAGRVLAHPDTRFALPEVGLGLIPGAGGTVSLTRRIGRQRTAALGLTGRSIDTTTALRWGLIDEIER